MSLLIKGMDMPKYNGEHNDFDRYGCYLTVYKNGKVKLHICDTDYDIVEVPTPHGDLIDRNLLLKEYEPDPEDDQRMKEESLKNYVLMTKIVDLVTESINKMPIIIEAEE